MWDRLALVDSYPEPGDRPLAAVLAPIYQDEAGELRLVLTKRPDSMPTHAGHISFPGGRPHAEDRNPVDTALREAQEEVGIQPSQVEVLGYLPPIDTVEFTLLVVPVVGRVSGPLVLVPSEREVARIHTPRLADLADPGAWWSI
ncbi:MAG: CoA pyrophosphatase, partial [Actinobacteria bacterium]|nr:CoA pyrophosphatase [Actinomycetota bacterium]